MHSLKAGIAFQERDTGVPAILHVSALPSGYPARRAIAATLEAIGREFSPLAASFFRLGSDGEIKTSVVRGAHLSPDRLVREVAGWKARLSQVEPLTPKKLAQHPARVAVARDPRFRADGNGTAESARRAYRQIGVINDVRLLIRRDYRLVGGVTLWRELGGPPWTDAQLARLAALQPLVEDAYHAEASGQRDALALAEGLTRRQVEVAELLAGGSTDAEVARALRISPNTAKCHVREVRRKLGVATRREAILKLGAKSAERPALPLTPRRGR